MIMNYMTRLYCGMVYRLSPTLGGGTRKRKTEPAHWEKRPGAPEEELQELLNSIRARVSILKTVVEEHSKEIEEDLKELEKVAYGPMTQKETKDYDAAQDALPYAERDANL